MRNKGLKRRLRIWFTKKSNKKIVFFLLKTIAFISMIVFAFYLLISLPILKINSFKITDDSNLSSELLGEVNEFIDEKLNEKMYMIKGDVRYIFNKKEFKEEILNNFTQIQKIDIKNKFLNNWYIHILKREVFGTICNQDEDCYLVDVNGKVFLESTLDIGINVLIKENIKLRDVIFLTNNNKYFNTLNEISDFLTKNSVGIESVSLYRDTSIAQIILKNSVEVWVDLNEKIYDTTLGLEILFDEVEDNLILVDARKPKQKIIYETE